MAVEQASTTILISASIGSCSHYHANSCQYSRSEVRDRWRIVPDNLVEPLRQCSWHASELPTNLTYTRAKQPICGIGGEARSGKVAISPHQLATSPTHHAWDAQRPGKRPGERP